MNTATHDDLVNILQGRFAKNMRRHAKLDWGSVWTQLVAHPEKLQVLLDMERTGGEPDVIAYDDTTREFIFCDCSPESPLGRRSTCYDQEARESRKENKPATSAMEMASLIGVEILTEQYYRALQALGEFDRKTSSWVATPAPIRRLGGAIFCDRRYDQVFVYHNGAESYYAARGFRGQVRV